uniref:Uncharacterized protein n=1 Tax=Quercus lobata TaxID=97700 RepID=A0A7N2N031_QUELO
MLKIVSSPELLEDVAQNDFALMRRSVVEFLKPEALQHFIPIMDSMAIEHLKTERSPYRKVKVYPLSMKYAFALAYAQREKEKEKGLTDVQTERVRDHAIKFEIASVRSPSSFPPRDSGIAPRTHELITVLIPSTQRDRDKAIFDFSTTVANTIN